MMYARQDCSLAHRAKKGKKKLLGDFLEDRALLLQKTSKYARSRDLDTT